MKKIALRSIAAILSVLFVLSAFAACTGDGPEGLPVHESVNELKEIIAANDGTEGTTVANLYFDNTQSMYGYICADTKETSEFTIVCQSLVNVLKGYNNYTLNALKADGKKLLRWNEMDVAAFNKFTTKDFYTYVGNFDKANGETGPLQSLFGSSNTPVNFDELNIFITDLAEQNLKNTDLASTINDIVLERADHSVALFCIEAKFAGEASVPVPGVTEEGEAEMVTQTILDQRPFYCLIVGPTKEVVSLCDELNGTLEDSGLKEGTNFYSTVILSKRGLQYSPVTNVEYKIFDEIKVDPESKYDDYGMYQNGLGFNNTNLNFNVVATTYDQIFTGVTESLPGLCYQYSTEYGSQDKSTFGNASINFMVPLTSLADGSAASIEEIKYTLNSDKDAIKVYGYTLVEETTTDEYGEEEEIEYYQWEEIPFFDMFEKSDAYMELPTMECLADGAELERVEDYANNEDLKDEEYPSDKLKFYTVDNENGMLLFNLRFKDITTLSDKYEMITIVMNVSASRAVDEEIPGWIDAFNLEAYGASENPEKYTKTANLKEFYNFLIGKMSSKAEREEFEEHMTKTVTDIVVNIDLIED